MASGNPLSLAIRVIVQDGQQAYLTVIDAKTGANLWSAKHLWGGLVTGFNNVGERLVKEFEKQAR
jgi:glucose dehydrogenase